MDPVLSLRGVTKAFGGLRAVGNLDIDVRPGEVVSVIGPNGAGKTTLFNLITGIYRPDGGSIELEGTPLVGKAPHKIAQLGVARTFQTIRLFLNMTVRENVLASQYASRSPGRSRRGPGSCCWTSPPPA
jgi:branched-chain amino acid transport system ATP-binding protein